MSESNLNLIINNYAVDKLTVENIAEIYKPRHGYIYCLYNKCFQYYGDNVYKLGTTINLTKRLNGYVTSFIDKSEYKHHSKQLIDGYMAEQMLFDELKQYRVTNDREFFNCEYNIILNAFTKVEKFFSEYNTTEKIIQYYLDNINNKKGKIDSTLKFINIYNAKNITYEEGLELINTNNLTNDIINQIKKYNLMCIFNLDTKDLTLDFIKNNTNNEKEINNYIILNKNPKYLELPKEKYTEKTKIIQKIINHFGYSVDNMNTTLDRVNFVEKLNTIKNIYNSAEFINLFGNYNENINNSSRAHIGYLNGLLHNWKLCIKAVEKNTYNKQIKKKYSKFIYQLMNYDK